VYIEFSFIVLKSLIPLLNSLIFLACHSYKSSIMLIEDDTYDM
ncbi:hypothetical protein Btaycd_012200, partial [Bartonella taylorii]